MAAWAIKAIVDEFFHSPSFWKVAPRSVDFVAVACAEESLVAIIVPALSVSLDEPTERSGESAQLTAAQSLLPSGFVLSPRAG